MNNVVTLKIKDRRLPPRQMLSDAIVRAPVNVITIEECEGGHIHLFASQKLNRAEILWFLENAKLALLAGED